MGRDSFILYTEQLEILEQLDDADVGKIMKAIFEYQKNGTMPNLPKELKALFTYFKIVLDKNAKKWDEEKQKRSEAGKKGMAKRWSGKGVNSKNNNVINAITKDNNVINAITRHNKNN